MRLLRMSLVALVAMTINAGCSAARNHFSPWRGPDRDSVVPGEHEYSPHPEESSDDEFRNPSGEPVPAPPARGISRVKSVSFLKDLSSKLHGQKDDCTAECVDDSELVGRCSPVEPCVPRDEHNQRVDRYVDRYYCGENTSRLNPLRSIRKSFTKAFHRKSNSACSSECSEIPYEPCCDASQQITEPSPPKPQTSKVCRKPEPFYEGLKPLSARPKPGGELADSLKDHEHQNMPVLSTPDAPSRSAELSALPAPSHAVPETSESPATPSSAVSPSNPSAYVQQSVALPFPPAVPFGTRQSIEPPSWPRLQGTSGKVSMLSSGSTGSSVQSSMIIQPRSNR